MKKRALIWRKDWLFIGAEVVIIKKHKNISLLAMRDLVDRKFASNSVDKNFIYDNGIVMKTLKCILFDAKDNFMLSKCS